MGKAAEHLLWQRKALVAVGANARGNQGDTDRSAGYPTRVPKMRTNC
jgi:hypothetical protein